MQLQDLTHFWAKRCLTVPKFCSKRLGVDITGSHLLIAYSTGCDSTALLVALSCLAKKYKLQLTAAHVHHGLRAESDAELLFAIDQCAAQGIPCMTERFDVKAWSEANGHGVEDSARLLRYKFLEEARAEVRADFIVTAHHGDDLAEDILMRLIRGCGWPALGGMTGFDPERRLLRPLLEWSKEDLKNFLSSANIPWCEDRSNTQNDLTRNRIRNLVLPLLSAENPSFSKSAFRLWTLARLDAVYWNEQLEQHLSDQQFLSAKSLCTLHPSLRLRIYKKCIDELGPGQTRNEMLLNLETAWVDQRQGDFQFPGNKVARITREGISFFKHHQTE